jgi:hypothetical protein
VNDRIFEVSGGLDRFDVLCECGRKDCFAQVEVTRSDYARLRAGDTTFLAAHGHKAPDRDSAAFEPILAPACAV